uniref:Uncharacterized protein n=1 Tax=Salmonella sp. TaxID=599 RepID=A0A482EUR2_SALSP|nr:hypothetical protein PADIICJD_00005 [Salmonella sp.]
MRSATVFPAPSCAISPPVSSSSNPLRTVPLPGSPSRSCVSARRRSRLHAAVPLGQHRLRALLLPDGRVIVEYLLTLPPQNARARCDQQDGNGTMVSHVWLTIRTMPFVRWLMAEDSFRSWSRMAALILFSLSFSSALTDCSCSLNAAFSISPVLCCCAFDFCSKSFASVKDCS